MLKNVSLYDSSSGCRYMVNGAMPAYARANWQVLSWRMQIFSSEAL